MLSQNQKESVISILDDYLGFSLTYQTKLLDCNLLESPNRTLDRVIKVEDEDDSFYILCNNNSFLYSGKQVFCSPSISFYKNEDIFKILSYCIELDLDFFYNYEEHFIRVSYDSRYTYSFKENYITNYLGEHVQLEDIIRDIRYKKEKIDDRNTY